MMTVSRSLIITSILSLVVTAAVWAQAPATVKSKRITTDEELWLRLADEPGRHLSLARERFFNNDRPNAAYHVRKAAVYLRISAQNSTRTAERGLLDSAAELESLARGVDSGSVRSINRLENAFARAEYALARHHYAMASESWTQRQTRVAGYRLRAAGEATERATRWTGTEVQESARTVYRGTRTLSGKLIEGTGVVVDEVGKGIGAVGHQIENVGRLIVPQK